MSTKPRVLFQILNALVVTAAIASILLRVFLAENEGRAEATADFSELTISLSSVAIPAGLVDPAFRARLQRHYAASPRLLLAWVEGRDGATLWRIPDSSPYLGGRTGAPGSTGLLAPLGSTLVLSGPAGPGSGFRVTALYMALTQNEVFIPFRDAAAGTAAWLLLSLLVHLASGRRRDDATWRIGHATRTTYAAHEEALREEEEEGVGTDQSPIGGAGEEEEREFEAEALAAAPPLREFSLPELEEPPSAARGEGGRAGPSGLFSPRSGIGWESYLIDRLDSELSRSASIEQDLALLALRLAGSERGGEDSRLVAKTLVDFFSFRDLAFERGEDGFAVILPNLDAEHALRMAEEFHKKLSILLGEKSSAPRLEGLPLYIGLSSRAGRLVEADRLLGEAASALERAEAEGDAKIVAFRPDPDKYRIYLASQGL